MTEKQMDDEKRRTMVEILLQWGINPSTVAIEGLTHEGYREFQLGPDGQHLQSSGYEPLTIQRRWPEMFPIGEFMEMFERYYL